jgi:hypothetical protein
MDVSSLMTVTQTAIYPNELIAYRRKSNEFVEQKLRVGSIKMTTRLILTGPRDVEFGLRTFSLRRVPSAEFILSQAEGLKTGFAQVFAFCVAFYAPLGGTPGHANGVGFKRLPRDKPFNGFIISKNLLRPPGVDLDRNDIRVVRSRLSEHAILDHPPDGQPVIL